MLFQVYTENGVKKIKYLTADTGAGAPVGSYLYLEKKSNPQGYLYCDGSTFDSSVYPALYQYLGTNVLPDFREFSPVGAEQNTTNVYDAQTNPNGVIHDHDVYAEGEAKDDQLQQIWGHFPTDFIAYPGYGAVDGVFQVSEEMTYNVAGGQDGNILRKMEFDTSLVTRSGSTTRGKRKAVFVYIKATSGLTENQQENVLNTINDNLSYSTTEHKTGKKWIDGKPIYEKTIDIGYLPNYTSVVKQNVLSNVDTVVSLRGMGIRPTEGQITIPYLDISQGTTYLVNLYMPDKTSVRVSTNFAAAEYYGYVTVEYTKTT